MTCVHSKTFWEINTLACMHKHLTNHVCVLFCTHFRMFSAVWLRAMLRLRSTSGWTNAPACSPWPRASPWIPTTPIPTRWVLPITPIPTSWVLLITPIPTRWVLPPDNTNPYQVGTADNTNPYQVGTADNTNPYQVGTATWQLQSLPGGYCR